MEVIGFFDPNNDHDFGAVVIPGIMCDQDLTEVFMEGERSRAGYKKLRAVSSCSMVRNIVSHLAAIRIEFPIERSRAIVGE